VKKIQRISILLIVLAPVFVGIILLFLNSGTSSSSVSTGFKKLGLVRVEGAIYESETVVRQLKEHLQDHSIAGVLLRIDSPGGATAPSQEIYQAVKNYRKNGGKPIVVSMGNVAASGGYYIASPATRIFAAPGTLTGSIGVIMTVPLYKELAKKIGIEMQTFKAGEFKDIASPYRSIKPVERKMIQQLLEDTHNQFIDDVAVVRSLDRDTLAAIADGRIFTGRQAVQHNLVDTLGGFEAAVTYLRKITHVGAGARLVNKKETSNVVREWFTSEMLHLFPNFYRIIAPIGLHCLTVIE
jgi:protease-4